MHIRMYYTITILLNPLLRTPYQPSPSPSRPPSGLPTSLRFLLTSAVPFFMPALQLPPIQLPTTPPQLLRRLFGRNIPLRLRHHLVPDQELPHARTSQQRRIEVQMQRTRFDLPVRAL